MISSLSLRSDVSVKPAPKKVALFSSLAQRPVISPFPIIARLLKACPFPPFTPAPIRILLFIPALVEWPLALLPITTLLVPPVTY